MTDEVMLDESQVPAIELPKGKTLDNVCVLLQQIVDILSIPTNLGVTLGGSKDAGESDGMAGQGVSERVPNSVYVQGRSA